MFDELFKNIKTPKVDAKITCRGNRLSAPKDDAAAKEADSKEDNAKPATSVAKAIDEWCKENNGKEIKGEPGKVNIYGRWGVTELQVPERSSFWLRATLNKAGSAKIEEEPCKTALRKGLDECDKDSKVTHGHTASMGDLDYHIDLSGVAERPDSPPWDEKAGYPPPESAPGKDRKGAPNEPKCDEDIAAVPQSVVSEDRFEEAVKKYCQDQDGKKTEPFGRAFDHNFKYPKDGWDAGKGMKTHLSIGVESVENKGNSRIPYDNMDWCKYVFLSDYNREH
jgi:hypothetical protein